MSSSIILLVLEDFYESMITYAHNILMLDNSLDSMIDKHNFFFKYFAKPWENIIRYFIYVYKQTTTNWCCTVSVYYKLLQRVIF